MEVGAPSKSGSSEHFMHKNRLQEFTQRSAIPLPVYQTINEGYPHAPQFRSTVVVDGTTFTSSHTFVNRKAAEQDVAKLALEAISRKIKHEGVPLIQEDTTFCKSILHEYAVKMNLEKPTYTTSQSEGLLPMFISSSVFDGQTYTGSPAKNKKEAEQRAARAVIEFILASSNTRTLMCEIIKSKGKLYAAMNKGSFSGLLCDGNVVLSSPTQNNSNYCIVKGKEVQSTLTNDKLPGSTYSADELLAKAAATESFSPEAKKPEEEYTCELGSGTIGSGSSQPTLPEGGLPSGAIGSTFNSFDEPHLAQNNQVNDGLKLIAPSMAPEASPCVVLNSGKKRSNKKHKGGNASKKGRTDEQLPPTPPANPCESSLQNA